MALLSALDTRYARKIRDLRIDKIASQQNFIYMMYIWSIAYSNLFREDKLRWADIQLDDAGQLDLMLKVDALEETKTKHQMTALLEVLKQRFPNIYFHFGLTSEDIMHNARWTQVYFLMEHIENKLHEVQSMIGHGSKTEHMIVEFTHGQPATPVFLNEYLKAKFVEEFAEDYTDKIRYRIGGSNGQSPIISLSDSQIRELEQEMIKLIGDSGFEGKITNRNLTQVGPSNGETLAFMSWTSLRCRNLARTLWDHASRGILRIETTETQTGSSAMPHKVNPIRFENAEGNFSLAYNGFLTMMQANSESRGLRDLSNSVVNRNLCEPFVQMILGLESLKEGLRTSSYSREHIIKEFERYPECLTELIRYNNIDQGLGDDYFKLKENPPSNLWVTLSKEKENRYMNHVYRYIMRDK